MPALQLTLIGTFAAHWNGERVTGFPTDKVRALLAYLALEGERPLRRETLATLLWPNYPDGIARRNLRQNLHRLTQLLDSLEPGLSHQLLTITRQTVQLDRAQLWLDVADLEARLTAVAHHPHRHLHTCQPCLDALTQAAQLARGDLLSGFTLPDTPYFDEWLTVQRERIHYQSLQLLHTLAEAQLQRGAYEAAYAHAAHQIALEPWREEAHRQMMLALARQGQRSEALAQYAACCNLLEAEMGASPGAETIALYRTILDESLPPVATPAHLLHHFPTSFTPFIGRDGECAQIIAHLQDPHCRLLMLAAPGGMGKTRLAAHAIQHTLHQEQKQLAALFPHGAYFVPLAEATTEAQLLGALAEALNLPLESGWSQLEDYLRDKKALLVLDNFEQLLATAVPLTTLLRNTADLRLLLTSREPLGVQAEWTLRLDGLPYPPAGETAVSPQQYPASQLFLQAARRALPHFQPDDDAWSAISRICQLVGGLPLALEMAAAWLPLLDCAQIAAQIGQSLDFLQLEGGDWPARHRSMRALLRQSWSFLDEAPRQALAQMAAFSGSFDLEAAQAVTATTLPTLRLLLAKSWVQRLENGRYILHQLIRQFASEQLAAQPALAAATRAAHSRHYLHRLQGYGAALHGPQAQAVIHELRQTQPNLALAWETAVTQQDWPLLQASHESLADYHRISGQLAEGEHLLALAVEGVEQATAPELAALLRLDRARLLVEQGLLPAAAALLKDLSEWAVMEDSPALLARWQMENGRLQELQGDYSAALASLQGALRHYQASGNVQRQAQTGGVIGNVLWRQGRYDDALAHFQRALAIANDMGDRAYQAILLSNIGIIYADKSDFAQGLHYYQQALAIDTELGNRAHIARHTHNIARVYRLQKKLEPALAYSQQALAIAEELGLRRGVSLCVTNIGIIYKDMGQYDQAEVAYQRALHISRELNLPEGESNNLGNLANLYRLMGRHDVAADYYAQALQLSRAIGYREAEARHLGNWAELHMAQQAWAAARELLNQAITILREIGEAYFLASMLILQAETVWELGEITAVSPLLNEGLALAAQTERADYLARGQAIAARLS